ncbi:MAG: hypothetical protein R3F59_05775 [Myxococcota bacterium]
MAGTDRRFRRLLPWLLALGLGVGLSPLALHRRAAPELRLEAGSQWVSGRATVLAGQRVVAVDGFARVSVRGRAVTVAVARGKAVVDDGSDRRVVRRGQTARFGPPRPSRA